MTDAMEAAKKAIGSFPTHDDDRGPDNETLFDSLPGRSYEEQEAFLDRLTRAAVVAFLRARGEWIIRQECGSLEVAWYLKAEADRLERGNG